MSTGIQFMDSDMLSDSGPYFSQLTTNPIEAGPKPTSQRSEFDLVESGNSPHGGIGYIDQSVGGFMQPRGDVFAAPTRGIVGPRQKTAPFDGSFIGKTLVTPNRIQGDVGRAGGQTAQRASAQNATAIPDSGDVIAAFTNPALARVINKFRGKR